MDIAVADLVHGANWAFARDRILVELRRHDYTPPQNGMADPNNEEKLRSILSARDTLEQIAKLRCQICGGYGHSKKKCPTEKKLTQGFQFARVCSSALVAARQAHVVANAFHRRPQNPVIPPNVGAKRRNTAPILRYAGPPQY